MMTRSAQWMLFLALLGSGMVRGQVYEAPPLSLELLLGVESETTSSAAFLNDDRFFPDLDAVDLTRASLVRPISFAAAPQDGQEKLDHETNAAHRLSASRC